MQASVPNTAAKPIAYVQNGMRKEISEDHALYMLESIANHDMQRALGHYLKLCNANRHAQRLLWKFYATLLDMFMFEELLAATNERLEKLPQCGVSMWWKINALQHLFRNEEAIAYLKEIEQSHPNDPLIKNTLGTFYQDVGDFEQARTCFEHAIALDPNYGPPHWHRSELSVDASADLAKVRAVIAAAKVPQQESHYLHFAAYRYFEKLGHTNDAFECLLAANAMKRQTFDYDVRHETNADTSAKQIDQCLAPNFYHGHAQKRHDFG
jgi:tetratricopeptide (TPR) repeat protein